MRIERGGAKNGIAGDVRRPEGLPHSSTGFTLIELVVAVSIVLLLLGTFLSRVWFYQEEIEKAAMEQVANALQSALIIQYGDLMAQGKEVQVARLATENPMGWLSSKPENYAGEFYDPLPHSVVPGSWVFDLKSRNLVYVPNLAGHFTPGRDGNKWVRYHVKLVYEPLPAGDSAGEMALSGVRFEPVEPYNWFNRGIR